MSSSQPIHNLIRTITNPYSLLFGSATATVLRHNNVEMFGIYFSSIIVTLMWILYILIMIGVFSVLSMSPENLKMVKSEMKLEKSNVWRRHIGMLAFAIAYMMLVSVGYVISGVVFFVCAYFIYSIGIKWTKEAQQKTSTS